MSDFSNSPSNSESILQPAAAVAWSWLQAIGIDGNLNRANDLLSDDLSYWTNLDRKAVGKSSIVKLGAWRARFAPITFTLLRSIVEGDVVVLEVDGKGVTELGRRYDNTYAMVFTVRDRLITDIREHGDTALMLEVFPGANDAWSAAKEARQAT